MTAVTGSVPLRGVPQTGAFSEPAIGPSPGPVVTVPLAPDYASVAAARRMVRSTLPTWRLEPLVEDACLVVSELVANALRHGLGLDGPAPLRQPIVAGLTYTGAHLVCSVTDPQSAAPRARRAPDALTGLDGDGRGLRMVEAVSVCWGWTALDGRGTPGGKSVWAVLRAVVGAQSAAARIGEGSA